MKYCVEFGEHSLKALAGIKGILHRTRKAASFAFICHINERVCETVCAAASTPYYTVETNP